MLSIAFAALLLLTASLASTADGPGTHDLAAFMTRGAFNDLDRDLIKRRLSLRDLGSGGLDGRPIDIDKLVELLAIYEKLQPRIDEPKVVNGKIRVALPPNAMGDEAYSACFFALTYNGLVLSGSGNELVLVRPETRPDLTPPKRRWNREHILSTRVFHLGYLNSDPILRRYRDVIGTKEGHAVFQPRSNVLIVTDTDPAIEMLGAHLDSETLEAMGTPGSEEPDVVRDRRLPSPGAIASRERIHFYLLAYARSQRIPLASSQQPGVAGKYYPEADLWTSDQGFRTLEQEYRRIGESIQLAREAAAQGWVDPDPARTLTPAAQSRRAIRFGLVSPLPGKANAPAKKKTTRRRP
jgi:hypothetical protein